MPYRIRYTATIDFVGASAGPMDALSPAAGVGLPGGGSIGSQAKTCVTNPALGTTIVAGSGGGTFPAELIASGDITTLLAAMSADLSTQFNASLATMQGWPGGNP